MPETAIAYADSGVGKTTICISLAKWMYKTYGLTTRLISSEGWEPIENEGLIKSPTNPYGIVEAFSIVNRPRLLSDIRKLSRGWWPKVTKEEINGEMRNVRRILEDVEALGKVGLYFIETLDGISDRFMNYIIQKEIMEYSEEKRRVAIKAIGPQGQSGRFEEEGEVLAGNSPGHFGVVQSEMHNLMTIFEGLGGAVKLNFWTGHVGIGRMGKDSYTDSKGVKIRTGEKVYCPLLVGDAKNSLVPGWVGECFHLEETPEAFNEEGYKVREKTVKAFYVTHHEQQIEDGIRFLAKSRVGPSSVENLQEKFPGGYVPLGTKDGEGLDQYYEWLRERKGGNVKNMKEWRERIDNGRS